MTEEQSRAEAVRQLIGKAEQALASAASELSAGRLEFAVNRAYYACFYSSSAVLLKMGHQFVKHSGLRAAVHQHLVKPGLLEVRWGKAFDLLFDRRQTADYLAISSFEREEVEVMIAESEEFVGQMKRILTRS